MNENWKTCFLHICKYSHILKAERKKTKSSSFNQNLYSALSRSLLRGAPDPGQAKKNSVENLVELRRGSFWEVSKICWKSIPGCWANHGKRTGLHCWVRAVYAVRSTP